MGTVSEQVRTGCRALGRIGIRGVVIAGCWLFVLAGGAPGARANAYLPPSGRIYAGLSAGLPSTYEGETGIHAPVFEEYVTWGQSVDWATDMAEANRARAMLHISTINPAGGEVISPGHIAQGDSDGWLLNLGGWLAARGEPTYIRIMAEMNGYWEPYSAFNANGTPRDREHSTSAFRQAWRRIVLILRGGSTIKVDQRLRALHMPRLRTALTHLAAAPVAFTWNPMTAGDPKIPANAPWAYFPGRQYVDWVGTDFFSIFPNWVGLNAFYNAARRASHSEPFMFGEWAIWVVDNPGFARQFVAWVKAHRLVRMLMYFQGYKLSGAFNLRRYPQALAVISHELRNPLFAPFAPEWENLGYSVSPAL